jgi:hypothetical protein
MSVVTIAGRIAGFHITRPLRANPTRENRAVMPLRNKLLPRSP